MGFYHLTIELIFDIIAIVMGVTLIIRPADNRPKFYWGIIAASIGVVFTWENIGWLLIRNDNPTYEYTDILNIEKMLKWYALAGVVSLFPLASLRPGYLTPFRILMYLIPSIIIITIGICFLWFNGNITEINSIAQIPQNIGKFDVKLRLVIFLFTIVTPLLYFLFPVINNKTFRKITPMMYLFIGFMFLLLGIYISFTLYINNFFFNGFGITSIVFSILFSTLYLRFENPLSSYKTSNKESPIERSQDAQVSPLYYKIDIYLKETHEYTNPNYKIEQLADYFGEKKSTVSAAIKSAGHTGFREYINYLRLEYFKYHASMDSAKTIKELMYLCGFTARSTFYRIFSEQYGVAPTKYIENQRNNN